jgi:basic membrane protein A
MLFEVGLYPAVNSSQEGRMRKRPLAAFVFFLSVLPVVVGCQLTTRGCTQGDLKVGMVTDVSGFDAAVSQQIWQGLQRADNELNVCAQFLESQTEADYKKNIVELAEQNYGLIVAASPLLAGATQEMAQRYPGIRFILVDGVSDPPLPNVQSIAFRVDQAAFPAGYLAAAWADLKDPADPQVGYLGSRQNPSAEQYITAYEAGVGYYNAQKGTNVQVKGVYVDDAEIPEDGEAQGRLLIDQGVDVIFEVSDGIAGGGLTAAKKQGKWGIGADVDQYFVLSPSERDILLTSSIKRRDDVAYSVIELATEGRFDGGGVYVGVLQNGGVGLAPFHDTESEIPNSIKQEVSEIEKGIIDGTLSTGWLPRK